MNETIAWAEQFRFFRMFTSHMVLQRRKPVRLAGYAEPQHTVKIAFAGAEREAAADAEGIWEALFPALEAGGPYTVTLSGTENAPQLVLEDVMIGEVWFCSGQSNMAMPMASNTPFWYTADSEAEVAKADHPMIRLFHDSHNDSISPDAPRIETGNPDGWQRCTPETARDFSACAYYFAVQLEQDLQIPVGVIAAAWGGSSIQAWISPEKMAAEHWIPAAATPEKLAAAWAAVRQTPSFRTLIEWVERMDRLGAPSPAELQPDYDDSNWQTLNSEVNTLNPPGRHLIRISVDIPEKLAGLDLILHGMVLNDTDKTYYNGELIGHTGIDTIRYWATLRHYVIPGKLVSPGKNTIAVVMDVHCAYGLLTLPETLLQDASGAPLQLPMNIRTRLVFALPPELPERPPVPPFLAPPDKRSFNYPGTLFHAYTAPWTRFTVGGILWYQGCNDAGNSGYYCEHKMLIEDWRERWHEPELPFLLVQLAAFDRATPTDRVLDEEIEAQPLPQMNGFAVTREIQAEMRHIAPQIGMITAFDCGDACDIHPREKRTLGVRLAKKAESMLFGSTALSDGPEFAGMRLEGKQIRVFFDHVGGGLVTTDGKPPVGFYLRERDEGWWRAQAKIDGDTVVLECPELARPQYVRYAFCGFCRVNLTNREGWPALPFRSDAPDYAKTFHA